MKKANSGGLFSGIRKNKFSVFLVLLIVVSVIGLAINVTTSTTKSANYEAYINNANQLKILSQSIPLAAVQAYRTEDNAFNQLNVLRRDFSTRLDALDSGGVVDNLVVVPVSSSLRQYIPEVSAAWIPMNQGVSKLLDAQSSLDLLVQTSAVLDETLGKLRKSSDEMIVLLGQNPSAQIGQISSLIDFQMLLGERMKITLASLRDGKGDVAALVQSYSNDVETFATLYNALIKGDSRRGIAPVADLKGLETIKANMEAFKPVQDSAVSIAGSQSNLQQIAQARHAIQDGAQKLLNVTDTLVKATAQLMSDGGRSAVITYALVVFIVALVILIGVINARRTSAALSQADSLNMQNQEAILRLLDEIEDLGDGDLTVEATVSEAFTGAIADSINFAVEQLRGLVETINQTAVSVSQGAQDTQSVAMNLAEASEHQAEEIASVSEAITMMANSINDVSSNAVESANVAIRSVGIANKGNEVVQNTIVGMDTIREQIQDTSKRIKRLGESSQEIGDIVSLIDDISDQTNILALNAAIQASMAGDAGRGFAVVADEIQRLAERTSGATKQIEALVKAIQTDTNEAVISMEQTTTEVVSGARLAQDAGSALGEIETVSKSLADLIQSISTSARQQASTAKHISRTMMVIQEISEQSSKGSTSTARNIGNLAKLARDMRESVSGFKLPEEEVQEKPIQDGLDNGQEQAQDNPVSQGA